MKKVAILGFGSRGRMFAKLISMDDNVMLVGIADTAESAREAAVSVYGIKPEDCYVSADDFFAQGKICDAVFICTQDNQHYDMVMQAYSGKWAAITLGTTFIDEEQTSFNTEMRQQFKLEGALTEGIRDGLNRLIMHVYYEGEDNVSFALVAKHKNNSLLQELKTVELHKGMNEIVVSLTPINWEKLGDITYFRITLADNESGQPQRTVYIADTVIYAE